MTKAILAILLTLVLFGTISVVACRATEARRDTFSVRLSPMVEVTVGNVDLNLIVGVDGEITVLAELRDPDNVDYKVYQEGDKVRVEAKTSFNSKADLTLTVPQNTEFSLTIGNGIVDVVDIHAQGVVNGNGR